ncbi:MYXO-CTERM sorting domain-containing protein [Sorangium sp. So ce1128]
MLALPPRRFAPPCFLAQRSGLICLRAERRGGTTDGGDANGGCGCKAVGGVVRAPWAGLGLLVLVRLRRRRSG